MVVPFTTVVNRNYRENKWGVGLEVDDDADPR